MKNSLILLGLLLSIQFGNAQVKLPAPSPTQVIKQDFALGSIEITYSRPSAKGRRIFGGLESYGVVWRTGANAATRIKFTEPVEFAGKKVDTGTYALYSVPGIDSWEIILNRGINNWGVDGYKESEDVVRFKIAPTKLKTAVETFTMQFNNVKPESCDLNIEWDRTSIRIPLTAVIREKIKSQLESAMRSDSKPYWQAAQFYNEYEKNLVKALENITAAVKENPKAFYMWLYKAKIEQEKGDFKAALTSSQTSLALSKEAKNDSYVKMNVELQKKLK